MTIEVTDVNDPPVPNDDAGAGQANQAITVSVLQGDVDPDGDQLQVSAFTQPANGTVDCTPAGDCTYTPAAGFVGTDSFEYTVSDGHGNTRRARSP